jgi:hypothetical protein
VSPMSYLSLGRRLDGTFVSRLKSDTISGFNSNSWNYSMNESLISARLWQDDDIKDLKAFEKESFGTYYT